MNTCDTCKWWRDVEGKPREVAHGCGKWDDDKIDESDWLFCECPKQNFYGDESDGFGVNDASKDDSIALMTGPKFGCIHHEPK